MTTEPATTQQPAGLITYDYASVRAPRDLELLYQDTYRSFGWTVESTEVADPIRPLPLTPAIQPTKITLKLKRDRGIRNRQMIQTLQRKAEASLSTISQLERSKSTRAIAFAMTVGIIGAALLAASMFLMNGGLLAVSIVLGATGIVAWAGGFLTYATTKARRTAAVIPLIDHEFDALYETANQAARLLK